MTDPRTLSPSTDKIILMQANHIDDLEKKCSALVKVVEGTDISREALLRDNAILRKALKNHGEEAAK